MTSANADSLVLPVAKGSARTATALLTLVSVFWGGTFLWMELGTESLRYIFGAEARLSSATFFLLVRYITALVLLPLLIPASVRRLDRAAWRQGFWLSIPFSIGHVLQVFGLAQDDVAPSQSAFLTSLYVVATPLLTGLLHRHVPPRGVLIGLPFALFGAAFISGPPAGGLSIGAWATIVSAVAFAGQIVVTDHASRRADPMALTFTMVAYTVPWMAATLLLAPGGTATLAPSVLVRALTDSTFVLTVLACSVLATVVALAVLNRWQKEMHPSRAAIVYTSEPVFASIISIIAGRDHMTGWLVLGAMSILIANLAAAFIGKGSQNP